MLNWALLKHPVNWVTVFLMVFIGTMALNLVLSPWHIAPLNSDELGPNSMPGPSLSPMQ
jgi:hypothetical protein